MAAMIMGSLMDMAALPFVPQSRVAVLGLSLILDLILTRIVTLI